MTAQTSRCRALLTGTLRMAGFVTSARRLLVLILCLLAAAGPVQADTHHVSAGDSIAAAIARAAPGDRIEVAAGQYAENLRIDKPLQLIGVGRPTLSGNFRGDVIRVTAQNVQISGFIIRDSGKDLNGQNAGIYLQPGAHGAIVSRNDFAYTLFGIWAQGVDDVRLEHNLITGMRDVYSSQRGNGIQLYNTKRAQVIGNHISFVRDGIYVDVSHHAVFRGNRMHHLRYGTHYMNSWNNLWEDNESYLNRGGLALMEVKNQIVRRNKTWGNSDHGIMLRTIQNAEVCDNIITGNARGIFIYDAEHNTLCNNLIAGNDVGMHVWAGIINNKVDGNDFIHNRETLRYIASRDVIWGANAGNYWSTYTGWDRNGDGRGDIAHAANDAVDRLLWKHPQARLLFASPAVDTLHHVARQFPIMRAPSVVDPQPAMRPHHRNWSDHVQRRR